MESSSICPLDRLQGKDNSSARMPSVEQEHQNFFLTEAQRIIIQHHLPKNFTLVPVLGHLSRRMVSSKSLFEDSVVFGQRKRGRPQGSRRKNVDKPTKERKSARIALVSRSSFSSFLREQQNSSSSEEYEQENYRPQDSRIRQKIEKEQEMPLIDIFVDSLEEHLEKVCPPNVEVSIQKEEANIGKLQNDKSINNNQKIAEKVTKEDSEKRKTPPKKTKSKIFKKQELNEVIPQGELLQTPTKKLQQPKQSPKEHQTEPSNKQIDPSSIKPSQPIPSFSSQRLIIRRLKSHKQILPFLEPVDEARDGAPNYYKQISSPMDLQTIEFKLTTGIYKCPQEFHSDIRLMWANSKTYNRKNKYMQQATDELERFYLGLLTRAKCGRKRKVVVE